MLDRRKLLTLAAAGIVHPHRLAGHPPRIYPNASALAVAETGEAGAIYLEGWRTPGDEGEVLLEPAGNEPGVISSADARTWAIVGKRASTLCFGSIHDGKTDNAAALEKAFHWLARSADRTLVVARGIACTSSHHMMSDGATLIGQDNSSTIRSIRRLRPGEPDQWGSPVWLGHWHPAHHGWRPVGSSEPYRRLVDLHLCEAAKRHARYVILRQARDAIRFTPGSIYFVRSSNTYSQVTTGVDIEVPFASTLVMVKAVDSEKGRIEFENEIGFDDAAPFIGRILPEARDVAGPVHFVKNATIRGLSIDGRTLFGSVSTGAFRCRMINCSGACTSIIQANGLAFCEIRGIKGTFTRRVGEFKFCSHDSVIEELTANSTSRDYRPASAVGLLSVGEGARNVVIRKFKVRAPRWSAGHLLQIQASQRICIEDGEIFAPNSTDTAILFYAGAYRGPEDITIQNVSITHSAQIALRFQSGERPPMRNRIHNLASISLDARPEAYAIKIEGGRSNFVSDCTFNKGRIDLGPLPRANRVATTRVSGRDETSGGHLKRGDRTGRATGEGRA